MNKLRSPLQAQLVQWQVQPGDTVRAGDVVVILEAMKMEHEVRAGASGEVRAVFFAAGETVDEGDLLMVTQPDDSVVVLDASSAGPGTSLDRDGQPAPLRADLQRVMDRHALVQDAARPDAVQPRHTLGLRTARETIADLCDADSFIEYGALPVAAQASTSRSSP